MRPRTKPRSHTVERGGTGTRAQVQKQILHDVAGRGGVGRLSCVAGGWRTSETSPRRLGMPVGRSTRSGLLQNQHAEGGGEGGWGRRRAVRHCTAKPAQAIVSSEGTGSFNVPPPVHETCLQAWAHLQKVHPGREPVVCAPHTQLSTAAGLRQKATSSNNRAKRAASCPVQDSLTLRAALVPTVCAHHTQLLVPAT